MGVKAFPVEGGGEGPSLETKRCSRGRFLVLLVAIYGLRRLNVGQRHFQEPSHHYSPPPGHLLRLPVYTLGPFSHVRDPPFVSGTIHTVSHRSPLSLSLSPFFIDRTERYMNTVYVSGKFWPCFDFED